MPVTDHRHAPRTAVRAVLVALVLGALLNGPGLLTAASNLQLGGVRDAAIAVAGGLDRATAALGLDRPRRGLADLRATMAGSVPESAATTPGARDGDAGPGARAEGRAGGTSDPAGAAEPGRGPAAEGAAASAGAQRGAVTAEDPLEVLLIGDSLIGAVADGYGRSLADRDDVVWSKDVRISTGLARPDVLDWPSHLEQQLAEHDPDVVVLMVGGNDHQSLVDPGGAPIHLGTEGWQEEYEARVGRLLDVAGGEERLVVWLELPAMRPDGMEEVRPLLNGAARRAADEREVVVVDTAAIVSPDGYARRVDGTPLRADDGVHLTHPGGDRVASVLADLIDQRWELDG